MGYQKNDFDPIDPESVRVSNSSRNTDRVQ